MKKSEMIEIIQEALADCLLDNDRYNAAFILAAIEQDGKMQPPTYKKYNYTKQEAYNVPDYKMNYEKGIGFYIEMDEWEPEDEKS